MKLTELAIKNKVTTYFLIVILLIGGYLSYDKSEKAQDPGFTIKVALITTNWPGATAKQMADLVSKRIADQVQNMDSLWYVNSTNTDGQSMFMLILKLNTKIFSLFGQNLEIELIHSLFLIFLKEFKLLR